MKEPKELKKLPDCELDIMMTIWEAGGTVTTAYIGSHLELAQHWTAPTLLNFLYRLEHRGFLECERRGKVNYYTPLVSKSEYLKMESRSLFRRLYGNSLKGMLTALYDGTEISGEELKELEEFLESRKEESNSAE